MSCFNPLRKGEAVPPLPRTTPYYTILLTVATSDTSKNIDLRVAPKTAPYPSVYTYPLAFPALKAILPCTRFQASLRNSQETAANTSDNVKFPVHHRLRRAQHPGPLAAAPASSARIPRRTSSSVAAPGTPPAGRPPCGNPAPESSPGSPGSTPAGPPPDAGTAPSGPAPATAARGPAGASTPDTARSPPLPATP